MTARKIAMAKFERIHIKTLQRRGKWPMLFVISHVRSHDCSRISLINLLDLARDSNHGPASVSRQLCLWSVVAIPMSWTEKSVRPAAAAHILVGWNMRNALLLSHILLSLFITAWHGVTAYSPAFPLLGSRPSSATARCDFLGKVMHLTFCRHPLLLFGVHFSHE